MFEWYQENYFKTNTDKCYLFLSPFSNKEMTLANYKIASSNSEELLGAVIDSEVTFPNLLKTSVEQLIKNSMHWRE